MTIDGIGNLVSCHAAISLYHHIYYGFFKWHHIPAGRALTKEEQEYAVAVLMAWIEKQMNKG